MFIHTIAVVSFGFVVSLRCTSDLSGSGSLVKLFINDPFRLMADQKIFGSMPCPGDNTSVMVVNHPHQEYQVFFLSIPFC